MSKTQALIEWGEPDSSFEAGYDAALADVLNVYRKWFKDDFPLVRQEIARLDDTPMDFGN